MAEYDPALCRNLSKPFVVGRCIGELEFVLGVVVILY
jgi:hypothetical protein